MKILWVFLFFTGIFDTSFGQEAAISAQLPEEYVGNWYELEVNDKKFKTPAFFRIFNNLIEHEKYNWMYAELHEEGNGYSLRIRRRNTEKTFHLVLHARGYLQVTEEGKAPYLLKRMGMAENQLVIERAHQAFLVEHTFLPEEYLRGWYDLNKDKGYVAFDVNQITVQNGNVNKNLYGWEAYNYESVTQTDSGYIITGFNENETQKWEIIGKKRWGGIELIDNGNKRTLYELGIENQAQIRELDRMYEKAIVNIKSKDKPLDLPHRLSSMSFNDSLPDWPTQKTNYEKLHRFLQGTWYATDAFQKKAYEFYPWYFKAYNSTKKENGSVEYSDSASLWMYVQFNQEKDDDPKNEISFLGYSNTGGIMFMEIEVLQATHIKIAGKIYKKQSNIGDIYSGTALGLERVIDLPVTNCEEHIQVENYSPEIVSPERDLVTWNKGYWPSTSAIFDHDESWIMVKTPVEGQLFEGHTVITQQMKDPTLAFRAYVDSLKIYVDGQMIYAYPWKKDYPGVDLKADHIQMNKRHFVELPKDYYNKTIFIHAYKKVNLSFDSRFFYTNPKTAGSLDHRSGISELVIGPRETVTPYRESYVSNYLHLSGLIFFGILIGIAALLCFIISWRQKGIFRYERMGIGLFLLGCAMFYFFPYIIKPDIITWWLSSDTYIHLRMIAQLLITVGWLYFAKELYSKKWYDPIGTLIIAHICLGTIQIIQTNWFPMTMPEIVHPELVFGSWKIVLPVVMSKAVDGVTTFLGAILYCTYHIMIFFDLVVIGLMALKNWRSINQYIQLTMIAFIPFVANYTFASTFQQMSGEPLEYFGAELYFVYVLPLVGLLYYLATSLIQNYLKNTQKVHDIALELERKQNELLRFEQAQMQSEYQALKSQISPHFLFNTFSSLMTVIEESQQKAVNFVQELSRMYRYLLQSKNRELETLDQELEFIESYMFLLRDRYGDYLRLHIDVDENILNQQLPALSLHLLVENAVKHNIISAQKPLDIQIFVENESYLVVKNNLQRKNTLEDSTRIGLENIKNRYAFYTENRVIVEEDSAFFAVKIPLIDGVGASWNREREE